MGAIKSELLSSHSQSHGFTLPPSATAGLKPGRKPRSQALWDKKASGLAVIRDQLTLSHWMLLGATLQALLVLLFTPKSWSSSYYAITPVLAIATWKVLQAIVAVSSYRPGKEGDHVIRAKVGATMEHDVKSDGGICLLILGTRSYHPLGIFAPGFKDLGNYLTSMLKVLENNSQEYDFLGYEALVETGNSRSNALKSHYYFRTYEGLHKFAHSQVHRDGWNWWNKTVSQHPHLGIMHETYHSPIGHWEAIFANFELNGIGATSFPYKTAEETGGEEETCWRSPMELANSGRLKTSKGRMLRTQGDDNDHIEGPPENGYLFDSEKK